MKKTVCFILVLCMLSFSALAVNTDQSGVDIQSPSAVLMHSSGQVLFEKNPTDTRPIASVTKIMTLLLVMEAIEKGSLSMADIVTASPHACSMGGSQIWLKEGEQFTVEEMIKAVVIASANDCAVALAEHIAGTEDSFVLMMNARAKELKMEHTTFKNACGLDEEGHLSCALDVAIMSRELMKYQKIRQYATTVQDSLRGGKMVLDNTNKMIRSYSGMTGLKTGYTSSAGYCLSATAEKNNTRFIAVVLGAETSQSRNGEIASLLNWGFAGYTSLCPTPDRPLMPVKVKLGEIGFVPVEVASVPAVVARKGVEVQKEITMEKAVPAPVKKGQKLGEMKVSQNGEELITLPIVALCNVNKITFSQLLSQLLRASLMRR